MKRILLGTLMALAPIAAHASTARVVEAMGTVERVGRTGAQALHRGDRLGDGEMVRVGDDGQARILVDDQAVVELSSGTSLRMQSARSAQGTSLRLFSGRLWAQVASLFGNGVFEVETDHAVAGVRGTSFVAEVTGGETAVSVENGAVEVSNRAGQRATIGALERLRVGPQLFERTHIEMGAFSGMRERATTREQHDGRLDREAVERLRGMMRNAAEHLHRDEGSVDARFQQLMREILRNRRNAPLDIDPGVARPYLERFERLRMLRRLSR